MRITTQGEYGLRCILNLTRNYGKGPLSIREISRRESLSKDYVEQLLMRLRRAGLVNSLRGTKGGYVLAKKPSDITMKDVIEALEGKTFEIVCYRGGGKEMCIHITGCFVQPIWIKLREKINKVLEDTNLGLLLKEKGVARAGPLSKA